MADQRPLNRAQLAKFLPDQESIRRFEKMFATVEELTPDSVGELQSMIASADSKAVTALGIALQALGEPKSPPFVQDRTFEKSTRVLAWLTM